jgi:hypothetical protein
MLILQMIAGFLLLPGGAEMTVRGVGRAFTG